MANLTSVGLTAGTPSSGTGTVSTLDNFIGTAGTASANVITVQGIASGTVVPISVATIPSHAVTNAGTFAVQLTGATNNVNNIAGTVSLPTGAATAAGQTGPNTVSVTNPTSTLTLPATTTAYIAAQLVASSATAGSVVVPSFAIANSAGAAQINALRLTSNDSTSTAWGGVSVQVDLWSTAPTFTNGNLGTYAVATGSAGYLGSFSGTFSAVAGDGVYARLIPTTSSASIKLASGTSVFWTVQTLSGTGIIGTSKVFTLTGEVYN